MTMKMSQRTIVGEQEMEALGMGSYLAVGRGSVNESLMSIMNL